MHGCNLQVLTLNGQLNQKDCGGSESSYHIKHISSNHGICDSIYYELVSG